jgi:hypothetical protein
VYQVKNISAIQSQLDRIMGKDDNVRGDDYKIYFHELVRINITFVMFMRTY